MTNQFSYSLSNNSYSKGLFDIYQAKNGGIQLCMGNSHTALTHAQVVELHIPCYELKEFSQDDFNNFYNVGKPEPIDWTRKDNDTNGNPRYVCHFLNFITPKDTFTSLDSRYNLALTRAKKLGGRKYHNKQYGGGIIFQCYNTNALEKSIFELMQQYK